MLSQFRPRQAARLGLAALTFALGVVSPLAPTSLSGTVRPVIAGAAVQTQRMSADGTWTTVATTTVDDTGTFTTSFTVAPGTYRARVAAGKGWAVAVSPELQVVKT